MSDLIEQLTPLELGSLVSLKPTFYLMQATWNSSSIELRGEASSAICGVTTYTGHQFGDLLFLAHNYMAISAQLLFAEYARGISLEEPSMAHQVVMGRHNCSHAYDIWLDNPKLAQYLGISFDLSEES